MSITMMDADAMDRFDALCRAVAAQGKGLTLQQLGTAGALAREMSKTEPDQERVGLLRDQLGIEAVQEPT